MIIQEQVLALLREDIEKEVGRKMYTPKDFDFLSECIFNKLHQTVSPTTLKRLWGYLQEAVKPRSSSLNVLALFVGYEGWEAYCQAHEPLAAQEMPVEAVAPASVESQETPNKKSFRLLIALIVAVFVVIVLAVLLILHINSSEYDQPTESSISEVVDEYVLKIGQRFATREDYLKLFGIENPDIPWVATVPHHPYINVWGPEYKNWRWHNYGDSAQMMPTITEAWNPGNVTQEHINTRMRDHYYTCKRLGEVRLAFMKNMVDTGSVFLGVYRMDKVHSDTTQVIWERIVEECDLNKLDYIESLRN